MPISILKNTKITAISAVVPTKEYSILDNPNLYGGNKKKIDRIIDSSGFLTRRVADYNITSSDLCNAAAENLLKSIMFDRSKIDGLLFVSYTPDYLMPATSYILHKKLGLSENCICIDIPQACSGYVLGLYQAGMMLNAGCRNVLLLVGDTFSKFTDMFDEKSVPVFGDAGSATLLQYDENATACYFNIKSDGTHYDSLMCENGGFRNPINSALFYNNGQFQYKAKMDGAKIFQFAIERITPSIKELLDFVNMKPNDFSQIIMHQANKFILKIIAEQLGVDAEKIPSSTLKKYGNQCGASIPCVACDLYHDIFTNNNNKVLMCGFGVGLSWISAIVNINNIYCSKLLEYKDG